HAPPPEHGERDLPEVPARVGEGQQHAPLPAEPAVAHPLVILVERQRPIPVALEEIEIPVELRRVDLVIREDGQLVGRHVAAEQERRILRPRETHRRTAQPADVGRVEQERAHAASLISAPSTASAPSPRSRIRYQTSAAHNSHSRCAWSLSPSKCSRTSEAIPSARNQPSSTSLASRSSVSYRRRYSPRNA